LIRLEIRAARAGGNELPDHLVDMDNPPAPASKIHEAGGHFRTFRGFSVIAVTVAAVALT
jgi:hypothetical protein